MSRAYVFENSEDGTCYSNTFEWCARGIRSQKDMLQGCSYAEFSTDYQSCFNESGILYCDDIGQLPGDIQKRLKQRGVKSMLQCAIRDNGVFKGWVGFDDCTSHCLWTISQIEVLSFVSELLSLFLLKQRAQDSAVDLAEDLRTILDHQNSWIYVVDMESHELLFINDKTHRLAPDSRLGMSCHEACFQNDKPCQRCPMKQVEDKITTPWRFIIPSLRSGHRPTPPGFTGAERMPACCAAMISHAIRRRKKIACKSIKQVSRTWNLEYSDSRDFCQEGVPYETLCTVRAGGRGGLSGKFQTAPCI
ncbi:MAG: hypothetical protein ACLTBV_28355 [Enterocloster bolteae]